MITTKKPNVVGFIYYILNFKDFSHFYTSGILFLLDVVKFLGIFVNAVNSCVQVEHQSKECPLRLITCRFCGDMVPAGNSAVDIRDKLRGLSEHESLCGSRTAPCDSCGRAVMLKDMDIHQVAVHQKS